MLTPCQSDPLAPGWLERPTVGRYALRDGLAVCRDHALTPPDPLAPPPGLPPLRREPRAGTGLPRRRRAGPEGP